MRPRGGGFRKILSAAEADAESAGWREVSKHLAVPALLRRSTTGDRHALIYEDVFAEGRCHLLLGDVIALADRDPTVVPRVENLVDGICRDLCRVAKRTGRVARLADCVPNLYQDRIRPGGRIDAWYAYQDVPIAIPNAPKVALAALSRYDLMVNGVPRSLDIGRLVPELRRVLNPDSRWMTALTQGDPTEPNVAEPLCWLDFGCAGRNTLAGEIANLLWYLLAMGGWLVPTYQPEVYARTLRLSLEPYVVPRLQHVDVSEQHRKIDVRYSWRVGAGRHAAVTRLLHWLRSDLAEAADQPPADLMGQIRAFMAMRILGVIPAHLLHAHDLILLLAKLAESQDADASLDSFARLDVVEPDRAARHREPADLWSSQIPAVTFAAQRRLSESESPQHSRKVSR
ncbi:hypothetical protein EV643_1624 [Kribbella sp. VKM Ac-2527]|uniref:Uncharacterized protein n=1 Tax=Kribbella caucasensis TaxID=2512215 RepID=A0A4R6IZH2_9ACTN|nr:hypothetical protein [Kribbella sp. VKM Ac-2527]TDO27356.1 hypothetical protein EV643_1624 [Kribbella sp. VKM Ac-2527]